MVLWDTPKSTMVQTYCYCGLYYARGGSRYKGKQDAPINKQAILPPSSTLTVG